MGTIEHCKTYEHDVTTLVLDNTDYFAAWPFILVSCIDSEYETATMPWAIGIASRGLGWSSTARQLVMPGAALVDVIDFIDNARVFNWFDEIWLATTSDVIAPPRGLWNVDTANLETVRQFSGFMETANVTAGFGDGDGLVAVSREVGLLDSLGLSATALLG